MKPKIVLFQDKLKMWRWRLVLDGVTVAKGPRGYESKRMAEQAAAMVILACYDHVNMPFEEEKETQQ